jgi:hypothetical protein
VRLKFIKTGSAFLVFTLCFCFAVAANAQKAKTTLKLADKREMVKLLLENIAKTRPGETIYVSTRNLPFNIQNDLSRIRKAEIKLVAPEKAENANLCHYQFGDFQIVDKFVSVALGDCNSGFAYDFQKIRGKWTIVPFVLKK